MTYLDLRPVEVHTKDGIINGRFHQFVQYSEVIEPSLMIGGHPGGTVAYPYGIVEKEDGSIIQVSPHSIKFVDR